jgi:hypothetical protein
MENKLLFESYKQYLVKIAEKEGRPFRLPKNLNSLEGRSDSSFFYVFSDKLRSKNIFEQRRIAVFLEVAYRQLQNFHITDIVQSFDELYEAFKNYKEDTQVEVQRKIKKAFDNLIEYCIINKVSSEGQLFEGSPPLILKLWKQGKLDERVLVMIYDLNKVKSKTWFRVYCGDLASRFNKVKKNINSNVHLSSFIEGELVKFKTIFK